MTDRAQFEAMLEALINEDQEAAKEIFHQIVVGKSREIYQELLESDFSQDQGNPYANKEEAVAEGEEEGEEEAMEEDGEEAMEEGDEEEDGADDEEGDDEEGEEDGEDDAFGDEEDHHADVGGEEELEDRVMDLEDALEDLKAEFEQLLSQEEEEGNHDMDAIHAAGDDEVGGEMGMDGGADELEGLMEYVNKVGGTTYNTFGKMGDNGTNTKSIVASKNDMGGTTANIAKSFSTTSGGTEGGLAKTKAGDLTAGLGTIQNRVDSKAGKTGFKKSEPGHGAEKAGKKETADNKHSLIGKKVK